MRTIPFLIAEALLSKIIVPDIRDSALGDLWEAHNHMRKEGKKRYTAQLVTAWRICLLLKASAQIYVTKITENNSWLMPSHPDDTLIIRSSEASPSKNRPLMFSLTLISVLFNIFALDLLQKIVDPSFTDKIFNIGGAAALLLETVNINQ